MIFIILQLIYILTFKLIITYNLFIFIRYFMKLIFAYLFYGYNKKKKRKCKKYRILIIIVSKSENRTLHSTFLNYYNMIATVYTVYIKVLKFEPFTETLCKLFCIQKSQWDVWYDRFDYKMCTVKGFKKNMNNEFIEQIELRLKKKILRTNRYMFFIESSICNNG